MRGQHPEFEEMARPGTTWGEPVNGNRRQRRAPTIEQSIDDVFTVSLDQVVDVAEDATVNGESPDPVLGVSSKTYHILN